MVEEILQATRVRAAARGEGPTLMQKTKQVHEDLHYWDVKVLKGPLTRIKKLHKELEEA